MFTAALFTIADAWKQPKRLSMEEWSIIQSLKKKKKEILLFATTRMKPEGIMLSEIRQTEKYKYCILHLYVESKKKK